MVDKDGKWFDHLTRGYVDFGNPEARQKAFVESVLHDVEGVHRILFIRDRSVCGDAYRVEIQFWNTVGQTVTVDSALEENYNMRDWRMICDRFTERYLAEHYLCLAGDKDPKDLEWPTPQPRVTFTSDPDENDIILTVRVVYDLPYDVWHAMSRDGDVVTRGDPAPTTAGKLTAAVGDVTVSLERTAVGGFTVGGGRPDAGTAVLQDCGEAEALFRRRIGATLTAWKGGRR